MRYELSDGEWATIRPRLPNKPRGVPRVDDRRVGGPIAPCSSRPASTWRTTGVDRGPDASPAGRSESPVRRRGSGVPRDSGASVDES